MKNISSIISAHNKKILNRNTKSLGCNCRIQENIPLNGECLTPRIIHMATVTNESNSEARKYIRLADTPNLKSVLETIQNILIIKNM